MQYPLKKYRLGLLFGAPYGSVLQKLIGPKHAGVDLFSAGDDNVYPLAEGKVVAALFTKGNCGGLVDIEYANGVRSRYCHLRDIKVQTGVSVTPNTVVGLMGATGTTYPIGTKHLHWVVWKYDALIDPLGLDYGSLPDRPLIERVNSFFRDVWGRSPLVKESHYFQKRVMDGIATEQKLLEVMSYWHLQPRVTFILEMQRYGFL